MRFGISSMVADVSSVNKDAAPVLTCAYALGRDDGGAVQPGWIRSDVVQCGTGRGRAPRLLLDMGCGAEMVLRRQLLSTYRMCRER